MAWQGAEEEAGLGAGPVEGRPRREGVLRAWQGRGRAVCLPSFPPPPPQPQQERPSS